MKKTISMTMGLLLTLTFVTCAYALHGGETLTYNFPSCSLLTANITNVSLGEWTLSPNCTEETAGNFNCNCSDNWTLYLTPAVNAIGNYTITMSSGFYAETHNVVVNYGGGGGGGGEIPTTTTTIKATTTTSTTVPAVTTTIPTTSTTIPTTTTTTVPATNPITGFATFVSSPSGISLLLSLIVLTALSIVFYKKRRAKKKVEEKIVGTIPVE